MDNDETGNEDNGDFRNEDNDCDVLNEYLLEQMMLEDAGLAGRKTMK
jgi:hypothetical protein